MTGQVPKIIKKIRDRMDFMFSKTHAISYDFVVLAKTTFVLMCTRIKYVSVDSCCFFGLCGRGSLVRERAFDYKFWEYLWGSEVFIGHGRQVNLRCKPVLCAPNSFISHNRRQRYSYPSFSHPPHLFTLPSCTHNFDQSPHKCCIMRDKYVSIIPS